MEMAIKTTDEKVDYINAHGTSTPVGDSAELGAVQKVFAENTPYISSTKSLTGHSLGAAGVQEAIYSLLMMKNNFMCKSAHIENIDDAAKNMNILTEKKEGSFNMAMSNSFGFGGTNASLIFKRYN
jgi:3-oxoacyl-[acyl-carrier-protein] synthase-1